MPYVEPLFRATHRVFRYGLLATLGAALLAGMIGTRAWPLVGDAALMHYVVFLLQGGAVPYREIVDINLPGTYFFEAAGMKAFGAGASGLRLYDWLLSACIVAAAVGLTGRRRWFPGLFAGLFFALIHLQDGVAQQGQRDLLLTALLLGGLGALRLILEGTRHLFLAAFAFGLAFGVSFTIKPVLLPLVLLVFGLGFLKTSALRSPTALGLVLLGLFSPVVVVLAWLVRKGALRSFLAMSHSILPLHTALGRKSSWFLVNHSFSPLGFLLLCCSVALFSGQARLLPHKLLLTASLAGALVAYVLQGKGYPYQRYPFITLLLVVIGLVLDRALDASGRVRYIAWAMVCWAAGLGMYFAWRAGRYQMQTPTVTALSERLAGFGSPQQLDGKVQCLDTFGGCVNTLYDLRIRQSTGFLYDCYLFTDASAGRKTYREQFWTAFQHTKPRLIVLSSQNCFTNAANGYDRLAGWPALDAELHQHYQVVTTWTPTVPVAWFSQKQMPFGFKLLLRKDD